MAQLHLTSIVRRNAVYAQTLYLAGGDLRLGGVRRLYCRSTDLARLVSSRQGDAQPANSVEKSGTGNSKERRSARELAIRLLKRTKDVSAFSVFHRDWLR